MIEFIGVDNWSDVLLMSIKKNHNIDPKIELNKLPSNFICSMTSNHTMRLEVFEQYMKWIEPMIDDIKKSPFSGHQMERSISLFYILNKINNVKILPNILHHFQFDTHKTQGIGDGKFKENYSKLL
jgi:hypothetical protein